MFLSVTQGDIDAARFQIALDFEIRQERDGRIYTSKEQWRFYLPIHDCPIGQALRRTFGLTRGAVDATPEWLSIIENRDYKYSTTTRPIRRFMAAWDNHERAAPRRFRLEAFS